MEPQCLEMEQLDSLHHDMPCVGLGEDSEALRDEYRGKVTIGFEISEKVQDCHLYAEPTLHIDKLPSGPSDLLHANLMISVDISSNISIFSPKEEIGS
jgi:hypothetical protein